MSWADADVSDNSSEVLAQRISDLEQSVKGQLTELRNQLSLALTAAAESKTSPVVDLEQQLERAVTVSLANALETIRQSLVRSVDDAVKQLSTHMQSTDVEHIAASLQHSVLLALTSFEQSALTPAAPMSQSDPPATARDVAGVSKRIDELKALLLG